MDHRHFPFRRPANSSRQTERKPDPGVSTIEPGGSRDSQGPEPAGGRLGLLVSMVAALLITLFLALPGLQWGLPSRTRNRLSLGRDPSKWHAPEGISQELDDPWEAYPNYVPGGRPRTGSQPPSAFNVIRSYHPDEYAILKSLSGMRPRKLKLFHGFYGWPAFHFYVVGAALQVSSLFGWVHLVRDLDFYFRNPEEMARLYMVGRIVTLLFGAGCIVVLTRAAARLFGWEAGAAAGMLLAVTPLFAINAHYMTTDVPMLFWMTLTFLASVHIFRGGGRRWYVLGGVFLGIAAATRYQGGLAAFLLLSAHLFAPREDSSRQQDAQQKWDGLFSRFGENNLWLAALVSVLVFFAFNPYILASPDKFWAEFSGELQSARSPISPMVMTGLILESALGVMFAAAVVGALAMALVRKERAVNFVLFGFGVPLLILCLARPAMVRYLMPVAPLPVLLVAWAFLRIHRKGVERRKRRTMLTAPVLLGVVLLATGIQSFGFCRLFSDPEADTRTRAGEWIANNIPKGATIGVVSEPWQFELPALNPDRFRLVVVDQDPQALAEVRPEFFVSSDLQFPPIAIRGPLSASEEGFWNEVHEGAGQYLVARRFEAWPAGRRLFLEHGPHDMRYPNPVIVISRRIGGAPKTVKDDRSLNWDTALLVVNP